MLPVVEMLHVINFLLLEEPNLLKKCNSTPLMVPQSWHRNSVEEILKNEPGDQIRSIARKCVVVADITHETIEASTPINPSEHMPNEPAGDKKSEATQNNQFKLGRGYVLHSKRIQHQQLHQLSKVSVYHMAAIS